MKKNLFNFLAFTLVFLVGFSSCKKDDFTGKATWKAADSKAALDNTSFTVKETDEDITIPLTITVSEAQIADIKINVNVIPGATATEGDDFTFDHQVIIPAHHTTGVCNVTIVGDGDAENDEQFSLAFGDSIATNVNITTKRADFTIKSNDLSLVFDWGGTVNLDSTEVELCDSVDMDVYVMNADTADLGIYDAATGACPESIVLSNYTPGDYYFWTALWQNQIRPASGTIDFPLTITAAKGTGDPQAVTQNPSSVTTSDDTDQVNDGGQTFHALLKVTVKEDGFDIIDPYTGNVLLSL